MHRKPITSEPIKTKRDPITTCSYTEKLNIYKLIVEACVEDVAIKSQLLGTIRELRKKSDAAWLPISTRHDASNMNPQLTKNIKNPDAKQTITPKEIDMVNSFKVALRKLDIDLRKHLIKYYTGEDAHRETVNEIASLMNAGDLIKEKEGHMPANEVASQMKTFLDKTRDGLRHKSRP